MDVALLVILVIVFVLPLRSHRVEENLEAFLLVAGIVAALVAGVVHGELVGHALREPIAITAAVVVAGLVFKWFRDETEALVPRVARVVPLPALSAILIIVLGFVSSVITAIVAALFLASLIHAMRVHRSTQAWIAVPGCFAIGFGAVLTPVGEPLATVVTSKLSRDFWYLARTLGIWVVPAVLVAGVVAAIAMWRRGARVGPLRPEDPAAEDRHQRGDEGDRDGERDEHRQRHPGAERTEELELPGDERQRPAGDDQARGDDDREVLRGRLVRGSEPLLAGVQPLPHPVQEEDGVVGDHSEQEHEKEGDVHEKESLDFSRQAEQLPFPPIRGFDLMVDQQNRVHDVNPQQQLRHARPLFERVYSLSPVPSRARTFGGVARGSAAFSQ